MCFATFCCEFCVTCLTPDGQIFDGKMSAYYTFVFSSFCMFTLVCLKENWFLFVCSRMAEALMDTHNCVRVTKCVRFSGTFRNLTFEKKKS